MNQTPLNFVNNPIRDAISRIRFAPQTNNLLISSWDSSLRLYDVESAKLRVEVPNEAALLDCCFENESLAFSAGSDGSIRRYDLLLGNDVQIGSHDELSNCIEYFEEKSLVITSGWDKKINFWDVRSVDSVGCLNNLSDEVESMSISGFQLMIAVGTSVHTHDLRNLQSVQAKESFMDTQIKCIRPIIHSAGFAVGSFDGRVALEYFNQSNSGSCGYAFRCHPKGKEGRHHLVVVNDIMFSPFMSGVFVTGDNEGYAAIWDSQSKKRLFEHLLKSLGYSQIISIMETLVEISLLPKLPRFPNSVVSLAYNHNGSVLAVASSCSYQDGKKSDDVPWIFMHDINELPIGSFSAGR